jgi:hypothetical protein
MLASEFFTPARLKEMRDEICAEGFVADRFLADRPDGPVFGVNLACSYPFPPEVRDAYEALSAQLSAIDPGVYVYPIWETHITIATLINFTQHLSPTPQRVTEMTLLMTQIATQLQNAFQEIKPIDLWIEQPVISRKAAILPLSDPSDGIPKIRNRVKENLAGNSTLQKTLVDLGLNIPPLVHSTVMRFKNAPGDTKQFLSKFDEIRVPRTKMRVNEIYLTTETKPYMRGGEIFHRFPL